MNINNNNNNIILDPGPPRFVFSRPHISGLLPETRSIMIINEMCVRWEVVSCVARVRPRFRAICGAFRGALRWASLWGPPPPLSPTVLTVFGVLN